MGEFIEKYSSIYDAFPNERYRMEEYTLLNQLMKKFRTGGRQRVRSKKRRFLEEDNFVLKKEKSL
jgi:hypothetical protein